MKSKNKKDKKNKYNTKDLSSDHEILNRKKVIQLFKDCPIPDDELLWNLGLFVNRQLFSRIIFLYNLYIKCLKVHGVVMEFGARWGQNLALFQSFRGILEPLNHNRKIIGFDTWEGFPGMTNQDHPDIKARDYGVTKDYEKYLEELLQYHETESPLSHIKKYQLIKGDISNTLQQYLEENPETIISFAYFDLDLYKPTKDCLRLIKGHLTKGSVIGFDELNHGNFPGETIALKEVFGLDKYEIQRSPISPLQSYIIIK